MPPSNQTMNKLMDILHDASAVMEGKPTSLEIDDNEVIHHEAFEPTPIGPDGIRVAPFSPLSFKTTFAIPSETDRRASVRAFQDFFFSEDTFTSNIEMEDPMGDVLADVTMVQSNGTIGNVVSPPVTLTSPFSSTQLPPPPPMSVTPATSPSTKKKAKQKKKLQTI